MLDTTQIYRGIERFLEGGKHRVRFLGSGGDDRILISVNTPRTTEVAVLTTRDTSSVVFSVPSFLDIVAGDLSPMKNFLHLTIRVPEAAGFAFESYCVELRTLSRTAIFRSPDFATAVFLSQRLPESADLLHSTGSRLQHLRLTLKDTEIRSDRVRPGANFANVLSWAFHSGAGRLTVLIADWRLFDLHLARRMTLSSVPLWPPLQTPPSFPALSPKSISHLAVFGASDTRIFILRHRSKVCVVEQLHDADADADAVVFAYAVYPKQHSQIVTVRGVGAGFPICVVREVSVVIVFVPNRFVCLIDMMSPIRHFVFGPQFAASPAGDNCSLISVPKSLINLQSGRIWQCQINFAMAIALAGIENHEFIALCAARSLSIVTMTALLSVMQRRGDEIEAAIVIREFFNCVRSRIRVEKCDCRELETALRGSPICETVLGQLDQMDDDFPSAGVISRRDFFWWALHKKMEGRSPEMLDKVAVKIMEHQLQQNAVVTALGKALESWRAAEAPSSQWLDIIQYLIGVEVEMHSLPRVAGFPDAKDRYDRVMSLDKRKDLADFLSFRDGGRKPLGAPRKMGPAEALDFDEFSGSDSMTD
jgi:hypothetical protein